MKSKLWLIFLGLGIVFLITALSLSFFGTHESQYYSPDVPTFRIYNTRGDDAHLIIESRRYTISPLVVDDNSTLRTVFLILFFIFVAIARGTMDLEDKFGD